MLVRGAVVHQTLILNGSSVGAPSARGELVEPRAVGTPIQTARRD